MDMDNYSEDLKYHKEHMWVRTDGTIGITFYAQDQLGEIVFIVVPEPDEVVKPGEAFGEVESRKSVSDLYSPLTGSIKEVNSGVQDAPELINCLLYTSDAADEEDSVDLGGRRIIK